MKPWEVTVRVWYTRWDRGWKWRLHRERDPYIGVWNGVRYARRNSARRAALRDMKRLGLAEKAKAGKV